MATELKLVYIPHDMKQGQGTWWIDQGLPCVRVSCPECGAKADLSHSIDRAGNVSPSLKCPGQAEQIAVREGWQDRVKDIVKVPARPPCGFHSHVKLLDWPAGWSIEL